MGFYPVAVVLRMLRKKGTRNAGKLSSSLAPDGVSNSAQLHRVSLVVSGITIRYNTQICLTHFIIIIIIIHRLFGLVARAPGYTTEMYCVSCEVRTEFIYVM
jgi:hypothetical protein